MYLKKYGSIYNNNVCVRYRMGVHLLQVQRVKIRSLGVKKQKKMKKEIIISAPNNEVTGLAQRRVLTGISVTPHTGHTTLSFDIQQLDLKGNPLDLSYQNRETDKIEFHSQLINTPEGVQGGELAQHEIDFLQGIYDLTETFLTAHEAAQEQTEGGEDEA